VRPESLHVTLKFIGEQSEAQVDEIKRALAAIEADHVEMSFRGYGFFPTGAGTACVLDRNRGRFELTSLAATVNSRLLPLSIQKRNTLTTHTSRWLGAPEAQVRPANKRAMEPNRNFQRLQESWRHCLHRSLVR